MKSQNNLNGHYCIANKLHYDKLVEDGYEVNSLVSINFNDHDRFNIINNQIRPIHKANEYAHNCTPMHLHNNEWVFGSLEHEEKSYQDKMFEALYDDELKPSGHIKFGCHCDLEEGQEPDGCVIDTEGYHILDCIYAAEGIKKEDCEYWRPYKSKPAVERITREDAIKFSKIIGGNFESAVIMYEELIEHLETLLDAKDIPRRMSEGVDHRIKTLAQRVLELESNQKEK